MSEKSKSLRATAPMDSERTSSSGTIYQHLEREILSGHLMPGQSLNESALAEQFGVSKTPVREALLQLAAVELIEFRSRQGAFVAEIPVSRIAQMFEAMIGLEAHCASLATERMTLVERKLLASSVEECDSWADKGTEKGVDRFFEADNDFHQRIFHGAHNAYLGEISLNLHNRLTPYRRYRLQSPARVKVSAAEHHK
ncbi:MAG: GntR family transcriptional regulator, partial [Bryobacteraceae bacterium]